MDDNAFDLLDDEPEGTPCGNQSTPVDAPVPMSPLKPFVKQRKPKKAAADVDCDVLGPSLSGDQLPNTPNGVPIPLAPEQDRNDKMLLDPFYKPIKGDYGPFHIDLCSDIYGYNSHCDRFCSLERPAQHEPLEGLSCYGNLPFLDDDACVAILDNYLQAKAKNPSTSAVFVVPEWASARVMSRLRDFYLVRHFPRGMYLYSQPAPTPSNPKARKRMGRTRWATLVYWDPPRTAPTLAGDEPPLPPLPEQRLGLFESGVHPDARGMNIPGDLNGVPCTVFLDSGAEGRRANFISAHFAERLGLDVVPAGATVTLGDDRSRSDTGVAQACLVLRATDGILKRTMEFIVLPMPAHHEVILGVPWFDEFNPDIDWALNQVTTRRPNQRNFVFKCSRHRGRSKNPDVDLKLLDAREFERLLDDDDEIEEVFLCYVQASKVEDYASRVGKETSASHLPSNIPPSVDRLIREFIDVFPEKLPPGMPNHKFRHRIELLEGTEPLCRYPYRLSIPEKRELWDQLQALIPAGRVRKGNSAFGAPVLFARKKDGGLRFCIDYRALNKATIKNKYPLPRIDECIDDLATASCFSSLDLASGFWQIPMAEEDIHKTAFVTPYGQYEWTVMPFGLCNAPSTFQAMMDEVLEGYVGKFVRVYVDDIVIYSDNEEEHLQHLRKVFERLRKFSLYCKPHKCDFLKPEIKVLGFIVGGGKQRLDELTVMTVRDWAVPTDASEVRRFTGFINHYRHFVPHLAHHAAPLSRLQSPKTEWQWRDEIEGEAFRILRSALCEAPILRLFNPDKPIKLVTDASNYATGACLLQEFEDGWHPIAYFSKTLNDAQRNYSAYDRELLAIYQAVGHWRHYLYGQHFKVVTDHATLKHLVDQPELKNSRRIRWISDLQEYDLEILYAPGKTNPADPLSRLKPPEAALMYLDLASLMDDDCELVVPTYTHFEVFSASLAVLGVSRLQADERLRNRIVAGYSRDPFYLSAANTERLEKKDGLFYLHGRICVPHDLELKQFILRECHEAPYSGHQGIKRTLDAVSRVYYWPRLGAEVRDFVNSCMVCQRSKVKNVKPAGLLHPLSIPTRRWDDLSLDFITHLPTSPDTGNDTILVVVDRLSKGCHLIPCHNSITAAGTAELFLKEVHRLHGLPRSLVSDRDPRFTSEFWQRLMAMLGTKLRMSSGYHPQTDGQTERLNRTIEEMLRAFCGEDERQRLWEKYLPIFEFEYNNSANTTTGYSPFYLWYGQHPHTPVSLAVDDDPPTLRTPSELQGFLSSIDEAVQAARSAIARAQRNQKEYYDKARRDVSFNIGDLVFVESTALPREKTKPGTERTKKFSPLRHGPFAVKRRIGSVAYELDTPATWTAHNVFHVSVLTPANTKRLPEPERILSSRKYRRQRQFRVRYKDGGEETDAWVPAKEVRAKHPAIYRDYVRELARGLFKPQPFAPPQARLARRQPGPVKVAD